MSSHSSTICLYHNELYSFAGRCPRWDAKFTRYLSNKWICRSFEQTFIGIWDSQSKVKMPIMTMSDGRFAQMFCCYWKMLLGRTAAAIAAVSLLRFGAQWFRQVVNNFARLFRSTWSATIPFYSMVWTIVWTCLSILHSVVCSDIPTF